MLNSSLINSNGLYVHIPFCLSKCPYCNFYSVDDLSKIDDYFFALFAELKLYRTKKYMVDTIYLGGGTPSVVQSSYIIRLLEVIYKNFNVNSNVEITIEVNPGTIQYGNLLDYKSAGINRLNIGVQSVCNRILSFLGRLHNFSDSLNVFSWARKIGFDNLGIDLIYGIPEQSVLKWRKEMEKIINMEPEHLSCYLLTFEDGTPMRNKVKNSEIIIPDDELLSSMIVFTGKFLYTKGYYRYEISNFSRNSYTSKHNIKYWNFDNYIGFGASAHSYMNNRRWWNHRSIDLYIADILKRGILPISGVEKLTIEQQIIEFIYLGLRQQKGLSVSSFKVKFGINFLDLCSKSIIMLVYDKFIKINSNKIILTDKALPILDSVVSCFCTELFGIN